MVTSSDALTLRDHTFKETGSSASMLPSNESASWEKQVSINSHVTMLGYKLKERQNFFLLFKQYAFIYNTEFDDDQMSKPCYTNDGGYQVDHESQSAMILQKSCGSRPELVLISCPVLLCINLPASHLPHPMLQLPAVGTGSLANTVPLRGAVGRTSLQEWEGCKQRSYWMLREAEEQ